MPIRKIAIELGISLQTSFDWRHKIVSSLGQFVPNQFSGIVECDELELTLSNKRERGLERKPHKRGSDFSRNQGREEISLTAVAGSGKKCLRAVESKRLSREEIAKVPEGKLAEGTILMTDKHPSYKAYAKQYPALKHKALLAKDHADRKDSTVHLQGVNNTHSQLRKFLIPFNGVSTKYLQNYLNWYACKGDISKTKTHPETMVHCRTDV